MKRVVIKWTYLLALVAFGAWMVDTFFGGNIYLRGEGLVIGQPAVVAAEFNMTVRDVLVKEGEKVDGGNRRRQYHVAAGRRHARPTDLRRRHPRGPAGRHADSQRGGQCNGRQGGAS